MYIITTVLNHVGSTPQANNPHFLTDKVAKNAKFLCYIAVAGWCFSFLEGFCWTRTAERQASRMRVRYLKAVLRQDVAYFDLHVSSNSQVITSVSSDSLVIQDCISEKVPNFVMNMSTYVGSNVVAFLMLWRLAIVSFPFVIFLVIPGLIYGRILMSLARKLSSEYDKVGTIVEQAISSVRTVYAFVGENKTISAFSLALEGSIKLGLKQGLAKGIAIGSNGVVFAIWAFNCWYGAKLVIHHNAQGGTIFGVGASLTVGGLALGAGLANIKYISEAAIVGKRIMEVIKRVPSIDSENTDGQILENVIGEVEFRNVKFSYPSRPKTLIFRDFCLKVPAGKAVALVGGSGSGKSTVISLLQRFYDPLKGEILIDGVAINKLQLKWLRSQMGLVSQEPTLFATSVKENVLFGKEDATMEEVIEAAKASNAHSFINQLPQGYDTQVGERGMQMSGGQKQRIAIARAIIRKPRILLLDEATSALDYESEHVVQEALDKASQGRTSFIIAHRLSTIRHADTIAVVHEGQVVECGSHGDLIHLPHGLYASLTRLQQTETTKPTSTSSSSSILNYDHNNSSSHHRLSITSQSNLANPVMSIKEAKLDFTLGPTKYQAPSFKRLLALNLPEWKQASIGCVCATIFGAVQPVYSYTMGTLIMVYFESSEEIKRKVKFYSFFFLGLFMLTLVTNVVQHYSFGYMGECLTRRVREKMLTKMLTFELAWFEQDENSTGSLCSRLAKDANVVRSLVGDRMGLIVQTISAVTFAALIGLVVAWKLSIVMLAVQPLLIACFYTRRVLLKSMSKRAIKSQDESSKLAIDAVSNVRIITSFSSQSRILTLLEKAQEGPRRESARQSWYAGVGLGTSQSLMALIWALEFWYGGKLVAHGNITIKQFFETFMILVSTGRVIADAGSMTTDIAKGSDAVGSVFAILDRVSKVQPDDPEGFKPDKIMGHVSLHEVDFAYLARPDVMIFKGFTLTIQPGESTALVGHSGSGKSTIIALIERFYDPIKGIVKIDGRDIRSYHLRSLRKCIALVSQEPTLFASTVKENIMYGMDKDVDEAEIVEAAKAANAHDFISGLKDGYDTWCGDRGLQLSGGQKQRIAIARAILKNPVILLLDEATSALDSQSEKVVQDALQRVMVGRTSVVVAHRLSTIQNCDTIAVLDKGKMVEKGTHSSLIEKVPSGTYYSLVNLQRPHNVVE